MRSWLLALTVALPLAAATAGCDVQDPNAGATGGSGSPTAQTSTGGTEAHAPEPGGEGGAKPWAKVPDDQYKTLDGGLKYAVLKPGSGPEIKDGQTAVMHYTGWLKSNGNKFDSSRDRGEPFTFPLGVGQVIPGWDKGVKGMKKGEQRQLVIPSEMGYGQSGAGSDIPPGADLVFDVELLDIR